VTMMDRVYIGSRGRGVVAVARRSRLLFVLETVEKRTRFNSVFFLEIVLLSIVDSVLTTSLPFRLAPPPLCASLPPKVIDKNSDKSINGLSLFFMLKHGGVTSS
jgi:hypothetical protein